MIASILQWRLAARFGAAFLAVTSLLAGALTAQTQLAPLPDSSFNNIGSVEFSTPAGFSPTQQALQPDGKILILGYGRLTPNGDLDGFVYRLNPDGSFDTGFGTNGRVRLDLDGSHDFAEDFAVLPDGKIIVLMPSALRILFVRLLPDGTYDPGFGVDGFVLTQGPTSAIPLDLVVQPDQSMLVVGYTLGSPANRGFVRRFLPDGSPDPNYGTGGTSVLAIDPTQSLSLFHGALQPDGKLVVTGAYGTGASSTFPVLRLRTNGTLDPTFSSDGIYTKTLGAGQFAALPKQIAVQPDGKILVAGYAPSGPTPSALTAIRIHPNGTADNTFGNFGVARLVVTANADVLSMVLQPDGKILLGGLAVTSPTETAYLIARLLPDGNKDVSFGPPNQGFYVGFYDTGAYDLEAICDMGLQPDGRLVATEWLEVNLPGSVPSPGKAVVYRALMDIVVATQQPDASLSTLRLFPNVLAEGQSLTLEYRLDAPRTLSAALYDAHGTRLVTLLDQVQLAAGEHRDTWTLPAGLPAGTYYVMFQTPRGARTLKLVKM